MFKFYYFSKKKNKMVIIYFVCVDDMVKFIGDSYTDFDFVDHYIKIIKD